MRWGSGEAVIERLPAAGHLERVQGAQAEIIDAVNQLLPNLEFF